MLTEFKNLSPAEQQQLFDAIPLIVVLVAGADGDIDEVELAEAQRLADIRSFNNRGHLNAYYEHIDEGLLGRIEQMINELPTDLEARQNAIFARLSLLNPVLAKMSEPFGYLYYQTFRSFAKHIAEAHGGFLRFLTIGPAEAEVLELPMLAPVARPSKVDYPDLPGIV